MIGSLPIDAEIKALARTDADIQRLMDIPGIGPTIATARVAAVGKGSGFGKGRDLAAWLGAAANHDKRHRQTDRHARSMVIDICAKFSSIELERCRISCVTRRCH
ncbi:transposase [Phaeobacter sp. 22II1-1F12B]|uniref:transposase n=1 Tax=Phaeobacter sp. 22II1-1F12B TaxID=1317111 RepID=UPI000B526375|nr:transposase [Phaeobacter sp. 22II1-1F12B]